MIAERGRSGLRGTDPSAGSPPCGVLTPLQAEDEPRCVAAACERVDQAELERAEAALCAAHLWSLLCRAAEAVDTCIAHDDGGGGGGTWDTLTLAYELRQALDEELDTLGAALLDELHAARIAVHAAGVLARAVHAGDPEQVARGLAAFEQARRACRQASGSRRAAVSDAVAAVGAGS